MTEPQLAWLLYSNLGPYDVKYMSEADFLKAYELEPQFIGSPMARNCAFIAKWLLRDYELKRTSRR